MSKLKKCLYLIDLLSRKGPMSLKEINYNYQYSTLYDGEILPRTFARYKDYIAEIFPCYIEYNSSSNKYYLKRYHQYGQNDCLYNYILSAYHIEGMSELAVKHRNKIKLTSAPTGIENVQIILEAIDKGRGIECDYYSFNRAINKPQLLIPYFLRTWEQRWYLAAEPNNHHHGISIFALKRMSNIRLTKQKMKPSNDVTPDEYWKGCFGVNHCDKQIPERIVIKVYGSQVDYVRALPIHESQKEVDSNEEYTLFEYHIVPCYNLYQQFLWHRERLEVIEPQHIRDEMAKIIEDMTKLYQRG